MIGRSIFAVGALALALGAAGCKSSDKPAQAAAGSTSARTARQPAGLPGQSEADLAQPVATIDGQAITVAELQDRINKQSPYVRARYQSMEQKKEFLDTIVRFEILAREADKRGFDEDPEVVRTMKQVMIQRLLKEEFDSRVKAEDISDEELRQYYEAHRGEYNKPEEVRVSAIITKDKAKAQKAAQEARSPAAADNKGFRDLVEKYSEDTETKARGGDLRFFDAESKELPSEVVKAAFALKSTGEVAGPIQTSSGWWVIKQTGLRKAINKSFDDVKRQIQNRLFREKRNQAMETFVADLRKSAKIEIDEANLAKVQIEAAPQPGAPASPHGGTAAPADEPGEAQQ